MRQPFDEFSEDNLKEYKQYMRDLERMFEELEKKGAMEADAAREMERMRLERVDKQIDGLIQRPFNLGSSPACQA